tara:strand:- start:477 stop:794 length:318 start_codon:yes stop_codon:yes gene_type:complete
MKSFKKFNEDASFARRSIGTGLLNFAGNVAKSLGTQPIEKGARVVTSLASMKDDFVERRKRKKAVKQSANKAIQNSRDPEADKTVAGAMKDPDLKKLDQDPPKWD